MRLTILTASLALACAPALAHHGWSGYDDSQALTFEGPVLASAYENPHGTLEIEAEGARWTVVLAPPSRMTARGLAAEAIAEGATVTVEGYPHREHENELRAERITVDGETVELR